MRVAGRAPVRSTAPTEQPSPWSAVALDLAVAATAVTVFVATVGLDGLPGQRWAALFFALCGPGWAIQRHLGRDLDAETLFIAAGWSIATTIGLGHVAVTVLGWRWQPLVLVAAGLTAGSFIVRWLRVGILPLMPTLTPARDAGAESDADRPDGSASLTPATWRWTVAVGTFAGLVAIGGLTIADEAAIDQYGLLPAIPSITIVATMVLVVCAVVVVGPRRRDRRAFAGLLSLLTIAIHGAPGIIESQPRFPVAWLHVGFIDQISTNGTLLRDVDARFSWPGFFAGGALVDEMGAGSGARWMIRFAPVVITLLVCLGIWALGRTLAFGPTVRGVAATGFVIVNWSGQDYLSPQAVGFLLTLTILVMVCRWFPGHGPASDGWLARLLRYEPRAAAEPAVEGPADTDERLALGRLAAVVGVSAAVVVSHQLSPVFLTGTLLLLGAVRLISVRWLGIVTGLLMVAWLSFGSEAWWLGHLDTLTGSVGDVGGIVDENVNERTSGATSARNLILVARLGTAALLWGACGLGLLWAWRRRPERRELFLAAALAAPVPPLILQPYGGEVLIRIYLFTLPPALLLLAGWALRNTGLLRRLAVGGVFAAAVPVLLLARFGNEEFEAVPARDVAATKTLLSVAPEDSTVIVANRQALIEIARVGELTYLEIGAVTTERVLEALETPEVGAEFVYFVSAQEAHEEQFYGRPKDWLAEVAQELVATGRFEVHHLDGSSVVLEYQE